MLIRTLLDAQKEIFKQELKEQSEMSSYLLQAKSTLDRFGEELNVLESIYIQNNLKNAEKYPQMLKYTGIQLELIQPTTNGAYIMTSEELPQRVQNNEHTVQALVDFQVKTHQKFSEPINLRRNLFVAENSNKEFGKHGVPMNNEMTMKLYNKEYKPNDFDEYTMSFKNLKSGLGITDAVKIKFTCAGINKIKDFIEQAEKLRELILSKKQDTISFQPDTLESMLQEIEANIQENAETYQNPKYNDDSTYYSKHWAVTNNVSSDIPLVLHIGIDYNIN